jgi:hypothetical protein
MAIINTGQVIRQRLPTGFGLGSAWLGLQRINALFEFGQIARPGFFEQHALLGVESFGLHPKAYAFMVSQLQHRGAFPSDEA